MTLVRVFLVALFAVCLTASAQEAQISQSSIYSEVTSNTRLEKALDTLTGTSGEWAQKAILGSNLSKKPIKIEFRDLSKISPIYSNFDALGWKDGDQLYIYLSNIHKNAPIQALGSILCHEAIHQDEYSSIQEETYGWAYEAIVWMEMKRKNPSLVNASPIEYPLVNRLNTLENMYKKANNTDKEIERAVSTNPGYRNLPEVSPGFGKN